MPEETLPWYEDLSQEHPFTFSRRIILGQGRLRSLAEFPEAWNYGAHCKIWSCTKLFDPVFAQHLQPVEPQKWKSMVHKFKGAMIVADEQNIYIVWPLGKMRPIQLELPLSDNELVPTDKINAVWALSPNSPYEPLVLFSHRRLVYIYNMSTQSIEGCLRGHGGEITSIVVHPFAAHIFLTTARDFTSRLYDLTRSPQLKPQNPHWPPLDKPSLAGPAHGLDLPTEEGTGIGRCVVVFVGGRSGGHQGEVLNAAFNVTYPAVATCGMDRAVKIWHIPYFSQRNRQRLIREDKPLFSSQMIHKARVLSVHWLSSNILLTHSAPAKMLALSNADPEGSGTRNYDEDEPGSLILWKWMSVDRFFPPKWNEDRPRQQVLRGFGSDYQESSSFSILANYFFPAQESQYQTPALHICRTTNRGPFVLFVYPQTRSLTIINVALFKARPPPSVPLQYDAKNLTTYLQTVTIDQLHGWTISLSHDDDPLESCLMIANGRMVIAGGSKGSLWIFTEKSL